VVEILAKKDQLKIFYFTLVIFLFVSIFSNIQNAPTSSYSESAGVLNVTNMGEFSLCLRNSFSQLPDIQINQVTEMLTEMGYKINLNTHFGFSILIIGKIVLKHHKWDEEKRHIPKNRIFVKETIGNDPGISLREIQRKTGLAMGVIQYHLNHLESKENQISSVKFGRCKHFFDNQLRYSKEEKLWLLLIRNEKIHSILDYLGKNNDRCLQKDLVYNMGYSRSLVSYYIKILKENGIIEIFNNQLRISKEFIPIYNDGFM
jgi:DNA-binding MarR family transcriptional regulator